MGIGTSVNLQEQDKVLVNLLPSLHQLLLICIEQKMCFSFLAPQVLWSLIIIVNKQLL
jgi:hypothetical protein